MGIISCKHTVVIHRPVADVWGFMSQVANATKWDRGVVEARQISPGPTGVGSTIETFKLRFGQRQRLTYRIVEFEPNLAIAIEAAGGPFEHVVGRYSMEPVDGGTRLTGAMQARLRGFFRLLGPLLAAMGASDNRADLGNVKRILETGA